MYWISRISRRELQNLGINVNKTKGNMSDGDQAPIVTVTSEAFEMNLFAVDINPITSEGGKLHLKATEQ